MRIKRMKLLPALALIVVLIAVAACAPSTEKTTATRDASYSANDVSDAIYHVVAAHRKIYTEKVVGRLGAEGVISAHEDFETRQALLLPAQLFRFSAEEANRQSVLADYKLKSLWPINQSNLPAGDIETEGLRAVASDPDRPFYGEDVVKGVRSRIAVYADLASNQSCVDCHNNHPGSPRQDFRLNEVMGAVIVQIPLE